MKNSATLSRILLLLTAVSVNASAKVLDINHWITSNGAEVYFVAVPQVPMLNIKIAFDAGSARDGDTPGVAALTNKLLNQGDKELDATQVAEKFENVGAEFAANIARDQATLALRTLTAPQNLTVALENFAEVINQPNFPEAAFKQKQAEQALNLQANLQSPPTIADNTTFATIYPGQPYSKPVLGTEDSIAKLNRQNVVAFYHHYYVGKNATIAIVGAINLSQAKQIAEQLTHNMPTGDKPPQIPLATRLTAAVTKHIDFPATQTVICLAQVGITHDSPDYFPLLVGNYTLGSGTMVSRLSNEVREKRGLSYYIYSYFNPLSARGPFIITLATRKDQTQQALDITRATLKQFLAQGPDAKELKAAQQYLTGSFPLRLASNSSIADTLLAIGYYHLPLNYLDTYVNKIDAVTSAQITAAFNRNIQPQNLATITVGKNV